MTVLCQTVFIVVPEGLTSGARSHRLRLPRTGAFSVFWGAPQRAAGKCSAALGFNHNHAVLATSMKDIPLNLLSPTSAERQPGSPSGRVLAMFPAVSFLCLFRVWGVSRGLFFLHKVRSPTRRSLNTGVRSAFPRFSVPCKHEINICSGSNSFPLDCS